MLGTASNWLTAGAKRAAKAVLPVLAAILEEGDVVELLMQGRVRGEPGLAALVGTKIVLANARLWKPDVYSIPLTATLQVQGMNYGHVANVVFIEGQAQEPVEQISDQQMAYRFTEQVRMRVASLAAQAAPEPPAPESPPASGPSTPPETPGS